jgi:hypothetical protein
MIEAQHRAGNGGLSLKLPSPNPKKTLRRQMVTLFGKKPA